MLKLDKSSSVNKSHIVNIKAISVTLSVLKLDKSNGLSFMQRPNIPNISVTLLVSKLDKSNDINELQAMLNPETSFTDSIMNIVYEVQKNHYKRKLNHASEVLAQIQKSNNIVAMQGANAIVISKKLGNNLKDKLKLEQIRQDMQQANSQLQPAVAAK